jgi:hypothetical protein
MPAVLLDARQPMLEGLHSSLLSAVPLTGEAKHTPSRVFRGSADHSSAFATALLGAENPRLLQPPPRDSGGHFQAAPRSALSHASKSQCKRARSSTGVRASRRSRPGETGAKRPDHRTDSGNGTPERGLKPLPPRLTAGNTPPRLFLPRISSANRCLRCSVAGQGKVRCDFA